MNTNFIVLSHGSLIYDLTTGITYEFHAQMDARDSDKVYARRVGFEDTDPFRALFDGVSAREFWIQLKARVNRPEVWQ